MRVPGNDTPDYYRPDDRAEKAPRVRRVGSAEMSRVPRPSSSLVSFWAVTIFGVLLVGDTLVGFHWVAFFTWLFPSAFVVWVLWVLLYRPIILFDANHVVIINPLRIVDAPWAHVTAVRQRLQLMLDLDDGKTVTCWASPFPDKPGRRRPSSYGVPGGVAQAARQDFARPLESARVAAKTKHVDSREPDVPVVRRWDFPAIIVGAVLVVACVIEFAIIH